MKDTVKLTYVVPESKPRATEAQIKSVRLCDDWLLVRPASAFEASPLIKPESIKESPFRGEILANGPNAYDHLSAGARGKRVQWMASAHVEPIILGGEGLLMLRARTVVAVLEGPIVGGEEQ